MFTEDAIKMPDMREINTASNLMGFQTCPKQQNVSMYLEDVQQKEDCKLTAEAGVKTIPYLLKACKMAALGTEVLLSCF